MELKLPLVIVRRERLHFDTWVPGLEGVRASGPSLAELRDELALAVMERFEKAPLEHLWRYQFPPHCALHHVSLEFVAQDRARRQRYELKARVGVLLEKWPGEDFYLAMPTRLPEARFALRHPDELAEALRTRLSEYCLEHRLESLHELHAERRERLDLLEVDADPRSPFPLGALRVRALAERGSLPEEREERRRMLRMRVRVLREVARNLSLAAQDELLDRAWGRDGLVDAVVQELDGRRGSAVVLVGPSGCGKTAIVHEVVRRLGQRHAQRAERRDVWQMDGNRFIAGMMHVGEWEARARELVEELVALDDVLFVDDLASLGHAGVSAHQDNSVAKYLEPHLARGELTVFAECTPERLENLRQRVPGFARLFRVVHVPAMTDRQTVPVLLGAMRGRASQSAKSSADLARLSPQALAALLEGCMRFYASEALPGRAVRLLDGVLEQRDEGADPRISRYEVLEGLGRATGLPPFVLGLEAPRARAKVVRELASMVVGQPEAIEAIADVVMLVQHSLSDPTKPIANFLFVGPTGVGKTETAKALAKYLFGSAGRMLRFDMSEFSTPSSIQRLVGSSGHPDGELTAALRAQPFRVVLFDEIEKADPLVFDALLQLLGEGRITDALGHTADARQCVLLMTSNLGVREAASKVGFSRTSEHEARKHYVASVESFFRPEFFNRIDRVVAFRSLGREALRQVVERALRELLGRRGIRESNVVVEVEPELLELLVEQAFDPRYGARPLRRALEQRLAVPLAHHLLGRRTTDLSVVRLYRRGQDMALAVHGLSLADRLALPLEERHKKLDAVLREIAELGARLERLENSAPFETLLAQRSEALQATAVGQALSPRQARTLSLVERVKSLREGFDELQSSEYEEVVFEEEEVTRTAETFKTNKHYYRSAGAPNARAPQATFREKPMQARAELLVRQLLPLVVGQQEELEVLELQIAEAAAGHEDSFTILWEPVMPVRGWLALARLVDGLPSGCFDAKLYCEVAEENGVNWRSVSEFVTGTQRVCIAVKGAGAGRLLEPFLGFALLYVSEGSATDRVLVRIERLDEGEGPEAVLLRDQRERARRAEWLAGTTLPSLPEGAKVIARSVLERVRSRDGQVRETQREEHVATGLALGAGPAIVSAILRAQRENLAESEPPENHGERSEHEDEQPTQ